MAGYAVDELVEDELGRALELREQPVGRRHEAHQRAVPLREEAFGACVGAAISIYPCRTQHRTLISLSSHHPKARRKGDAPM